MGDIEGGGDDSLFYGRSPVKVMEGQGENENSHRTSLVRDFEKFVGLDSDHSLQHPVGSFTFGFLPTPWQRFPHYDTSKTSQ